MLEYNHEIPTALIEYKHKNAREPNVADSNYQALTKLADGYRDGPLAFAIAIYDPDCWSFRIIPVNERAKHFYAAYEAEVLTEQEFVESLYALRSAELNEQDKKVIAQLNDVLPEQERSAPMVKSLVKQASEPCYHREGFESLTTGGSRCIKCGYPVR